MHEDREYTAVAEAGQGGGGGAKGCASERIAAAVRYFIARQQSFLIAPNGPF